MKPRFEILRLITPLLSAVLLGQAGVHAAPPQPAAPAKATAATNAVEQIPQSVFLVTSPTQMLRDPFFPDSTHRPATMVATTRTNVAASVVDSVDLKLKAIFGTPERPLATINSGTFEIGEERDLVTPAGRVRVRCVDIRLADETVVVEAAGARRELHFSKRK